MQNFISKAILACVGIFTTAVLLLMALYYYQEFLFKNPLRNIIVLFIALIVIAVAGFSLMKIRTDDKNINRIVLFSMIIFFMVIALIWISLVPKTQVSDYGNFWLRLYHYDIGDPLYQTDNDYFSKYAYQTGFMYYAYLVSKVFGYNIFAIQFLNVIYQGLTLLFTYLLVDKIFNNIKMARLSVLLLMIDLDWFALNAETSNQYLGSLLYLITFYLIIQNKTWTYALAGVTLTAGCLIRPIGPVIIAGIVVFTLIYLLWKQRNYKASLKVLMTLIIYFVLFSLAGWGIKASGMNEYGLANNDPEWKFVTGLNYQSVGTYSPDMERLIDASKSRATMSKVEKAALKDEITYLNENHAWIKLFIKKTQLLWSSRTLATDGANFSMNHNQKTVDLVNYISYLGSVVLIVFSWIGSMSLFKTKFDDNLYLLLLPLMAFAVVQLIIEVQGRYRIEFLPIISVMASLGIYNTIKILSGSKLKQKKSFSIDQID